MGDALNCWHCGKPLGELLLPLSRRETCRHCAADLHCCRFCRHYDPAVAGGCREERAEQVNDRTRANFCDYLAPRGDAFQGASVDDRAARAQLAELFGDAPPADPSLSAEEKARAELERLFGGGDS